MRINQPTRFFEAAQKLKKPLLRGFFEGREKTLCFAGGRGRRRWSRFFKIEPLRCQGQFLFALLVEALQFGVRAFSLVWVFTKNIGHRGFL